MSRAKIPIPVDERALPEIDRQVEGGVFPNPGKTIDAAGQECIARRHRSRLARECAKLDVREERALAEEGYAGESGWPEY